MYALTAPHTAVLLLSRYEFEDMESLQNPKIFFFCKHEREYLLPKRFLLYDVDSKVTIIIVPLL